MQPLASDSPLANLFEALFKAPLSLYQRAEWVFAPLVGAGWLWALGALMTVLVAGSLLWRARSGGYPGRLGAHWLVIGALQIGAFALLLLVLSRPGLEYQRLTPGANTIAVLVDRSESMAYPATSAASGAARTGDVSRMTVARTLLEDTLLPDLQELGNVATFAFADAAAPHDLVDMAADGGGTRLVDALAQVMAGFRGVPLAAVVVLTDGADTDAGAEPGRLAAAGVPVHTVAIGPRRLPGEVRIAAVGVAENTAPDSRVVAQLRLRHRSAGQARIRVRDGSRVIAARDVVLHAADPEPLLRLEFDSGPGGIRDLTFEVEPPPGDLLADNNRVQRLLTVSDRTHRVLYLEGEPRWEYKFLRRALQGDPVLALSTWLRTTDRKTLRQNVASADELDQGFPVSRAELYRFDVVLLGSLEAAGLNDEQHRWLESFVGERGGSLLAIAGRAALADGGWQHRPLADVLPVTLAHGGVATYQASEGVALPTEAGRHSPVIAIPDGEGADPWRTLPALGDYQQLGAVKPAATVLLQFLRNGQGQPQPLLITQPYGLGTAAVLATATTWRWQMRTAPEDVRHTLFWRQLLRQLAEASRPRQELSVAAEGGTLHVRYTDRDEHYRPRDELPARATVLGEGAQALAVTLAPAAAAGVVEGRLELEQPGVYRVDVPTSAAEPPLSRFVRIGEGAPEQSAPERNDALLERIAETTGGRYWRPDQVVALADSLALESAGVRHRERLALWNMPALLGTLLLLKLTEWLLRRRRGAI